MGWITWFGRWNERDQAIARVKSLKEGYGGYGDRVIRLSARTDIARKSAGSTKRAFEYVENAFVTATQEYARIGELIERLEAGLSKGQVGNFTSAEAAVRDLGPKLDELDRHLTEWEAKWRNVPLEIDDAQRALASLRVQVEGAAAQVGAPLPLSDRLARLEQHLERTRQVLAEGNPIEAAHLVGDMRLALDKASDEAGAYISGATAIAQAEQETAQVKEQLASHPGASADAVGAVAAVEALVPRLRPALAAGKLEQFQGDLFQIQRHLGTARAALAHRQSS